MACKLSFQLVVKSRWENIKRLSCPAIRSGKVLEYGITTRFTTCIQPFSASLSALVISEKASMNMRTLPVVSFVPKVTVAKRSAMVL